MKKLMKHAFAFMMALVLVISPMQAFAAETDELPTEARYDIEKGGTQTFVIKGEDGESYTVTVEELACTTRVADGKYKVGIDNVVWNANFDISVKNNQIYNADNPYFYSAWGVMKYPGITRPNVYEAAFAFIYQQGGISYATGVHAKITNGEIIVTRR